jgi:hypothetical protein
MVTLYVAIYILPDASLHRSSLELNIRSSRSKTRDSNRSFWIIGVHVLFWTFANVLGTCFEVGDLSIFWLTSALIPVTVEVLTAP